MSGSYGLAIAASGLAADQAEINTIDENLANVNTAGYAAEQVNLSNEPGNGPLGVGLGVEVGSVSRLTDAVYAAANVAAEGQSGSATEFSQIMSSIESVFPEPTTNGLATQLQNLWTAMQGLATNPNESGSQQAVVQAAQTLTDSINSDFTQLSQLQTNLENAVGTGANDGGQLTEANNLLAQIANLNAGVVAGSSAGQNANQLQDATTAAVDTLAGLLGVSAVTQPDGTTTVYLQGVQLVQGNVAQTLGTTGSGATENLAVNNGNGVVVSAGGSIGAMITGINTTIPDYVDQLNSVADALAGNVNALQANGLDVNGDPGSAVAPTGYTGTILPTFFVNGGSSTTYTAASGSFDSSATITVNPSLVANASLIATAAAPGPSNSNAVGTPTYDGTNAQAMAALASSTTGADALYQTLVGALGNQSQSATQLASSASALATTAANNLSTISGVNENTEEVALIQAQNDFEATSQVVNAINQSLQSLIQAV